MDSSAPFLRTREVLPQGGMAFAHEHGGAGWGSKKAIMAPPSVPRRDLFAGERPRVRDRALWGQRWPRLAHPRRRQDARGCLAPAGANLAVGSLGLVAIPAASARSARSECARERSGRRHLRRSSDPGLSLKPGDARPGLRGPASPNLSASCWPVRALPSNEHGRTRAASRTQACLRGCVRVTSGRHPSPATPLSVPLALRRLPSLAAVPPPGLTSSAGAAGRPARRTAPSQPSLSACEAKLFRYPTRRLPERDSEKRDPAGRRHARLRQRGTTRDGVSGPEDRPLASAAPGESPILRVPI
jgi:hypothetical protein